MGIQLKLAPNTRGTSLLCILNYSATIDGNIWRQAERVNIRQLSQQPQATLLFWAPVAGRYTQLHQLPTHIAQNAPSSSPYSFIIFSLYCISTRPHSSITLSLFFPCGDLFQLPHSSHPPPPICLSILPSISLLLTRSSDCIVLHLHSSGGSSSCKYACPGSCCGCCALYSHWAPCQTGMVARIR